MFLLNVLCFPLFVSNLYHLFTSLFFYFCSFPSGWTNPSVSLSVYNSTGQLIEKSQEVLQPALSSVDQQQWAPSSPQPSPVPGTRTSRENTPSAPSPTVQSFLRSQNPHVELYWGAYWHMATPLQNLEAGSFVLIELRNGSSEDSTGGLPNNPTTFWTRYALDFNTVNSAHDQVLPLNMVQNGLNAAGRRAMLTSPSLPPLAPRVASLKAKNAARAPGADEMEMSSHELNTSQKDANCTVPAVSQLTVDCALHRKDRMVAFEQIMST